MVIIGSHHGQDICLNLLIIEILYNMLHLLTFLRLKSYQNIKGYSMWIWWPWWTTFCFERKFRLCDRHNITISVCQTEVFIQFLLMTIGSFPHLSKGKNQSNVYKLLHHPELKLFIYILKLSFICGMKQFFAEALTQKLGYRL